MKRDGMNLVGIKQNNRALLLQMICTAGQITRSELSGRSHLSPMTVTNITTEFLQENIIEEVPPLDRAKSPGRTPMTLQISETSPVIIGIFVTKSCLFGAVGDLSLHLLSRETVELDRAETEQTVLQKLHLLAEKLIRHTSRAVLGIGISTAGVVDLEKSGIRYITDFYGIRELRIREYFARFYPYPVFVENDMQASGLCELYFGLGRDTDSFLYVGVTFGLGGAVVTRHELLDACGEMGHMSVDCNGPQCACGGRGCLELYCSTPNIIRSVEQTCGIRVAGMEQAAELAMTNKTAFAVLYDAARHLACGINNYLNLIDVSLVILGHDAYYLPDELVDVMRQTIAQTNVSIHRRAEPPRFAKSSFGSLTPLYGSICVVLQQIFQRGYEDFGAPEPQANG